MSSHTYIVLWKSVNWFKIWKDWDTHTHTHTSITTTTGRHHGECIDLQFPSGREVDWILNNLTIYPESSNIRRENMLIHITVVMRVRIILSKPHILPKKVNFSFPFISDPAIHNYLSTTPWQNMGTESVVACVLRITWRCVVGCMLQLHIFQGLIG
jgi:hypothetical protein